MTHWPLPDARHVSAASRSFFILIARGDEAVVARNAR